MRVCLNCIHYEASGIAHQCRERRAEPVAEKHVGNFCEWFDFIRREWKGAGAKDAREQSARDALKNLLGD
jgi:hypothetical protein